MSNTKALVFQLNNKLTEQIQQLLNYVERDKELASALELRFNIQKKIVEHKHYFERVNLTPIGSVTRHRNILDEIEDCVDEINLGTITRDYNGHISNLNAETHAKISKFSKKSSAYADYFNKKIDCAYLEKAITEINSKYAEKFNKCNAMLSEIADLVDEIVDITRSDDPKAAEEFEKSNLLKQLVYKKFAKKEVAQEIINKNPIVK